MIEKDSELTFGTYLRKNRIEQELTIERVSKSTHISTDVIELIEKEDHRKLPEEVFVRGFLRLYSKELCLDEEDVLFRYNRHLTDFRESLKADLSIIKNDKDFWKRIISIVFVFSSLIFIITQILFVSDDSKTTDQKNVQVVKKSSEKKKNILELKIKAVEDTWLKIIIDDQPHKSYTLSAGDTITLKAERNYNIMIGSATAAVLTLNGKPVETYGKTGQILNVVLP